MSDGPVWREVAGSAWRRTWHAGWGALGLPAWIATLAAAAAGVLFFGDNTDGWGGAIGRAMAGAVVLLLLLFLWNMLREAVALLAAERKARAVATGEWGVERAALTGQRDSASRELAEALAPKPAPPHPLAEQAEQLRAFLERARALFVKLREQPLRGSVEEGLSQLVRHALVQAMSEDAAQNWAHAIRRQTMEAEGDPDPLLPPPPESNEHHKWRCDVLAREAERLARRLRPEHLREGYRMRRDYLEGLPRLELQSQ